MSIEVQARCLCLLVPGERGRSLGNQPVAVAYVQPGLPTVISTPPSLLAIVTVRRQHMQAICKAILEQGGVNCSVCCITHFLELEWMVGCLSTSTSTRCSPLPARSSCTNKATACESCLNQADASLWYSLKGIESLVIVLKRILGDFISRRARNVCGGADAVLCSRFKS